MSFEKSNTKVLHLELTTRCNAACPQCSRMDPDYNYTTDYDLSLEQVKSLFTEDFVRQLEKVYACGSFGDPAAAKNCWEILSWFREINPEITLGMNTNGGLRNTDFWSRLGKLFNRPYDYVVFSIDGLEDTNHLYRVNVVWDKVMANSSAFIAAGGSAHWDMLVYEHNEHQVESCKKLAKNLGFTWFRSKVSSRFAIRPVEFLKPPRNFALVHEDGPVKCQALSEKSLYVAATGKLVPCCFIGNEIFRLESPVRDWIDEPAFDSLHKSLHTEPIALCKKYCSTANSVSRVENQFRENIELKNFKC